MEIGRPIRIAQVAKQMAEQADSPRGSHLYGICAPARSCTRSPFGDDERDDAYCTTSCCRAAHGSDRDPPARPRCLHRTVVKELNIGSYGGSTSTDGKTVRAGRVPAAVHDRADTRESLSDEGTVSDPRLSPTGANDNSPDSPPPSTIARISQSTGQPRAGQTSTERVVADKVPSTANRSDHRACRPHAY
jgi:hypothetical protein